MKTSKRNKTAIGRLHPVNLLIALSRVAETSVRENFSHQGLAPAQPAWTAYGKAARQTVNRANPVAKRPARLNQPGAKGSRRNHHQPKP